LDRRLGIERPQGPPFTLNNTVDLLVKREFDKARAQGVPHPLMVQHDIDAVPMMHPDLDTWRDNWRGISAIHHESQFEFFGAIDDVWITPSGELHIVDYKATSSDYAPSLQSQSRDGYKRQMEMYQWLFAQHGFDVSSIGYFVFFNATRARDSFDARLEFLPSIIAYRGSSDWVGDALTEARLCLEKDTLPVSHRDCEWCAYRKSANVVEGLADVFGDR
jgi:RecB family exonuclease